MLDVSTPEDPSADPAAVEAEELQWLRGFVQRLRLSPIEPETAALVGFVVGGAAPQPGEFPAAGDDLGELRDVVRSMPRHLRTRADDLLRAYEAHVRDLAKPASRRRNESGLVSTARHRELVRLSTGGYLLDQSDAPPMTVDDAADLEAALASMGAPRPESITRILGLVGADAELRGFQNLGGLIESQLGIQTRGPQPDLAGYEVKTLSAKATADRPFVVLFGKAPDRLVPRRDLLTRYCENGRRLDMGKLRVAGSQGRFVLTAGPDALLLADRDGTGLMSWRWDDLEDRLARKMSRLILLTARSTRGHAEIRSATVFLDLKPRGLRATARGRNFILRVRLQERSRRDTFEFSMNFPGLRAIYRRWLTVRPNADVSPIGRFEDLER